MRTNVRQIDSIIAMHHSGMSPARIAEVIELCHIKHIREQAIVRAQNELRDINVQLVEQMNSYGVSSDMLEDF